MVSHHEEGAVVRAGISKYQRQDEQSRHEKGSEEFAATGKTNDQESQQESPHEPAYLLHFRIVSRRRLFDPLLLGNWLALGLGFYLREGRNHSRDMLDGPE